jgi:hypothetical protein
MSNIASCISRIAVALSCIVAAGLAVAVGPAVASGRCPNEALRVGPSASLPDCRAYEVVANLGGSADMILKPNLDSAVAASDGEHLALHAETVFAEPGVHLAGTDAVYSRTAAGWTAQSIAAAGMAADTFEPALFSPDLSQVALMAAPRLSDQVNPEGTKATLYAGPTGGPYTALANIPNQGEGTELVGANAGTPGVPAFSDVLLQSFDSELLPPGHEREIAEATNAGKPNLYEWNDGRRQLVNVEGEGSQLRSLNPCGASLGAGTDAGNALNAVSADGSKVFFTSPVDQKLPGCLEPALYMRVDGRETVDVSEPEGVSVAPSERGEVAYDGASADGSKVFFMTATALTRGAGAGFHLYEYATEAPKEHRLTLIANEAAGFGQFINPSVVVSEDGSTVYYEGTHEGITGIWHYQTATGETSFVAAPSETLSADEAHYATPNGSFLTFPSGVGGVRVAGPHGLEVEPRGEHGENELYRYDAADGSVVCVSCGARVAPKGKVRVPEVTSSLLVTPDSLSTAVSISEDGQRVFFETTAKLVPQDTNESTAEEEVNSGLGKGVDVYEWEADGAEEGPGLFCGAANGCTHLISTGEEVGPENFVGASANGENVFFTSEAQLVPQATPEFTNIYDARVDGGFAPPPPSAECTSCQGVGSPPPLFNTPAAETFYGASNPSTSSSASSTSTPKPLTKAERLANALKACKKKHKHARAVCEKKAKATYGKARGARR